MVPWSHSRQPFSGWVMTVLTAEFTHFKLVIHLSKLQQLALLFVQPFSGLSCCSCCPRDYSADAWSFNCVAASELPETSGFITATCAFAVLHWHSRHDTSTRQAHDFLQVWCLFLLMVVWWGETYCASNSLELGSCFMPLRQDLTIGPGAGNNRTNILGI